MNTGLLKVAVHLLVFVPLVFWLRPPWYAVLSLSVILYMAIDLVIDLQAVIDKSRQD